MGDIVTEEATKGIAKAVGNLLASPISEMSELIADQIRYFRWRALVKIAERAKEIRVKRGIDDKSIPLKILLPILEEGSKEEDTSDMCERWAHLLASVDSEYNSFDLVCVDFLKKMSRLDAEVVDSLGTYRDPKVFRKKIMHEVLSNLPALRVAIDDRTESEPSFSERDRARYFKAVNICLETDLRYCWSTIVIGNDSSAQRTESKFATDHPETVYALNTLGIIDHGHALHFNPDFSSRVVGRRGAHAANGKWAKSVDYYSIYRYRLTQVGELFWRKVTGK